MSRLLPTAVVFDCDGTIADTESLSDRAWTETLERHGYQATREDFRAVIGHPFPQNWSYFRGRAELGSQASFRNELRARFIELFERELDLHEDAVRTLHELSEAGVPIAVASSSSNGHVRRVLERGGLTDRVQVIIGADDVSRHKPEPEPYLTAAAKLGVDPSGCSAVEDTPVGVASAVAAGMFTVGIVRAHMSRGDLAAADRVVTHLDVASLLPDRSSRPADHVDD